MEPNASRRVHGLRRAGLALIFLCFLGSAALAQEEDAWVRASTEVASELRSASPDERARAAYRLEELLVELDLRAAERQAVSATQGRLYVQLSELLARSPDRPDELDSRALMERASAVSEATGVHSVQAYGALKLGELLTDLKDYERAHEVLTEAVERYDRDVSTRILIRLVLARIAGTLGDHEQALHEVDEARTLLERIDQSWSVWPDYCANVLARRCSVLLSLGNPDRAALVVQELKELGRERQRDDIVARAFVNSARVQMALGRGSRVERDVARALELGAPETSTLRLLRGLARAYHEDPEVVRSAEAELQEVVDARDALATDRERARFVLAELALCRGDLERAAATLVAAREELDHDAPEAVAVLTALEAERVLSGSGREAASETAAQAALSEIEQALERFFEAWDRTPVRSGGVGFLQYASRRRVLDVAIRLTLRVHGHEDGPRLAFELLERAQARGTVARRAGYRARGIDQIRSALVSDERGLVTFLPSFGRSHLFALDRHEIVYVELPSVRELEQLRREFVAVCSAPPRDPSSVGREAVHTLAAARELAAIVWPQPVRDLARRWSSVRFAGLSTFGYLPFEFLPEEDESREVMLGDRLAISYLPSMPVGVLLAERPRRAGGTVLLIAAERPQDASLPTLPLGEAQLDALVGTYEESETLHAQDATRDELASDKVRRASLLQVLAHGVTDFQRERTAGFALADGAVWCSDVEAFPAPPLVCLWVCNAGQGPLRVGEDGLATLGDAYLTAGARAVVVSPVRIEYRALLDLARVFHGRLALGDAPDEALRQARLRLRETDRAHPFFSLVHVVGLGELSLR